MSGFKVYAPLAFFEKASAPKGQQKRIAGVVSTELEDKQEETLLQRGLNFAPFLRSGWFNDNHSKATTAVLGYPDHVRKYQRGERLPDGEVAKANCTWAEGYLLETPDAQRVWELGKALQKSPRRLGFSIEGKVKRRSGPNGKVVAEAEVHNVAITNCPVGEETRMEVLAKSLAAAEADDAAPDEDEDEDGVGKALSMGTASGPPALAGPQTGAGAGAVLTPQSLEGAPKKKTDDDEKEGDAGTVSKSAALGEIQRRFAFSSPQAEQAFRLLFEQARVPATGGTMSKADFEKGLQKLEQMSRATTDARTAELFQKASNGTLSTEEKAELVKSLSAESLADQVVRPLTRNNEIAKSLDVSAFLREQHKELVSSLTALASRIEKSGAQDHDFRVALAQTIVQMGTQITEQGKVIKSLVEQVEGFGKQPARAPKSQGVTVVEKSFAGANPPAAPGKAPANINELSKAQIEDAMSAMLEKGASIVGGEDLLKAASKYETLGLISPPVLEEVHQFIRSGGARAA